MFLYNIMQIWGIIGAGQLPEVTYKTSSIMPGLDSSVTCRPVLIAVKITYISVELKYSKLSGSNFLLILGNNGYQPTQHGKLNAKKLIQIRLLVVQKTTFFHTDPSKFQYLFIKFKTKINCACCKCMTPDDVTIHSGPT